MDKMKHIVYKITNTITNKIYIGVHSTDDTNDGYMGSSESLSQDLLLHGKQHFKHEVLFYFDDREEAFEKEKQLVDKEFVKRKDTYNKKIGGAGWTGSPGHMTVKDQEGNCFKVLCDDPRIISGELVHPLLGTKRSPEAVEKTASFNRGRKASDSTKEKMSKARTGKKHSEETLAKMSKAQKGRTISDSTRAKLAISSGSRTHSDEIKKKIGEVNKGTVYIYCPVTDTVKRVKKNLINKFLLEGWVEGQRPKPIDNHNGQERDPLLAGHLGDVQL